MSTNDSKIKQWSTTPASNGLTPNVTPYGAQIGWLPSQVGALVRQQMSDHEFQWRDAEWFLQASTNTGIANLSYNSATSFKIPTDVTSEWLADRRIKAFDASAGSAATYYGTIVSSSYSAPDTTVNVIIDGGSSLTNSLSGVALAILRPTNTSLPGNSFFNKNQIIGGNFDTNPWQRGTTFTAATSVYTADRFNAFTFGVGVFDVLKTADAPTVAQAGMLVTNCLNVDVTTADAAIAAGDIYYISQKIEGYNAAQFLQKTFTLSFWVKSTVTGVFCCGFINSGSNRSYVGEYTVNASNTWEKKTITVSASPTAGTWDYTTGVGLNVVFTIAAGITYQTTAGSWAVGNFVASSNQSNGMSNTSNFFKIALVQLETGSSATPFEIRTVGFELSLCQRYYTKTFPLATAPSTGAGIVGGLQYIAQVVAIKNGVLWEFPVGMRVSPTITYYNVTNANTKWYNTTDAGDSAVGASELLSERGVFVANAAVGTDGPGEGLVIHADAAAEL